jgi:hypothetical protein
MNGLRIVLADADPAGLPAEVWLLEGLLIFTFVLHLFFMNAVLGGGLVWLWSNWRARRTGRPRTPAPGPDDHRALASAIGRLLPVTTAFAITTGVAPLLFTQLLYGQLFYTASVLMAWPWFAIVPLLLAGYYANYGIAGTRPATGRAIALGAVSSVLFLLIGFVFTNNMTLMLRPEQHAPLYFAGDAGWRSNAGDLWVWPRFAHMLVGSIAICGLVIAWIARLHRRLDPRVAAWMGQRGARLFGAATLVQFVVGIAFFFALPVPVREVFEAGVTPDAILLVVGVAFALAAVVVVRRSLLVASCATLVAVIDMAVVRHRVRALLLEPYFQPESVPVVPQTAAFVLFAVLLVAGLAVVGWMVWKFAAARPAEAPADAALT